MVTQRASVTIKYTSDRRRRRSLTQWSPRGHASIVSILFIAGPIGVIYYKTIYIGPLTITVEFRPLSDRFVVTRVLYVGVHVSSDHCGLECRPAWWLGDLDRRHRSLRS